MLRIDKMEILGGAGIRTLVSGIHYRIALRAYLLVFLVTPWQVASNEVNKVLRLFHQHLSDLRYWLTLFYGTYDISPHRIKRFNIALSDVNQTETCSTTEMDAMKESRASSLSQSGVLSVELTT